MCQASTLEKRVRFSSPAPTWRPTMKTLVLNASYEPIRIISWERAIYYLVLEKADTVTSYDKEIRSQTLTLKLPKVIKLKKYVKMANQLTNMRYSKRNILLRDKMICQYCRKRCTASDATMDHVIPSSRGGKTSWTNIVTACHKCNNKKDNKTPSEAGMRLLNTPVKANNGHKMR